MKKHWHSMMNFISIIVADNLQELWYFHSRISITCVKIFECLTELQPEGIRDNIGEYSFESGQDVKLFCTLTEAGLSEGLVTSDLRFKKTSSGSTDVEPGFTLNQTTVFFLIANASMGDSGRYYCENVSRDMNMTSLDNVYLNIGCKTHLLLDDFWWWFWRFGRH